LFVSNGFEVFAVGGDRVEEKGAVLIENIVKESTIGFYESFKKVFYYKKVFNKVKEFLLGNKVEAVILVDFWGFNSYLGEFANSVGIPVFYYISPQVWASREGRIKKMKKWLKKIFVAFPFEVEFYKNYGIDVTFVGHPLLDIMPEPLGEFSEKIKIGVFPGSRAQEVNYLYPCFIEVIKKLKENFKDLEIYLFSHPDVDYSKFLIPDFVNIVREDKDYTLRKSLTFALVSSGTTTLENTILGIPMIIAYKVSFLTYLIAKMIVKVKYIGMPNILYNGEIVPEFIQKLDVEQISKKAVDLLEDRNNLLKIKEELLKLRDKLGSKGVSKRVYEGIVREL